MLLRSVIVAISPPKPKNLFPNDLSLVVRVIAAIPTATTTPIAVTTVAILVAQPTTPAMADLAAGLVMAVAQAIAGKTVKLA